MTQCFLLLLDHMPQYFIVLLVLSCFQKTFFYIFSRFHDLFIFKMNIIFYYNYVYIFYTCYLLILASRSPPLLTRISRLQAGFCGGQSPTPPKGSHQHPALSELCPGLPPWEGAAGVHGKARGGRGASPPAVQLVEQLSARPLDHPTLLQQSVMRR